ncbi:MAG: Tetratricopeptide repeat [Gemmataceae bacterium]|nr:Tetratricopeptide repeat [Gemmataceae bacterium]
MTGRILAAAAGLILAAGTAAADDKPAAEKPTPAGVLLKEGRKLRDAKEYEAAREFFEAADKLSPGNPAVMVQLAWVCNEQQEHDKAARVAQEVLKIEPGHSDALSELGYAQFKQKLYAKAIVSLKKAVEKDEKNWTAYGYLADALRAVGEKEEADEVEATRKKKMSSGKVKD